MIDLARKSDCRQAFDKAAEDNMRFYAKPSYDFMYEAAYAEGSTGLSMKPYGNKQAARPTVNLSFNMTEAFLSALYHRNPTNRVTPRRPTVPDELLMMAGINPAAMMPQRWQDEVRARLVEWWTNSTPIETGLVAEARSGLLDGLLKGRGVLWAEWRERFPGSATHTTCRSYVPVDDIDLDPDVDRVRNCKWLTRKFRRPVYEVAAEFGIPEEDIRGKFKSTDSIVDGSPDDELDGGNTADLCEYYEVYSRMGLGAKLAGVPDEYREILDRFGDHVYLVVCSGCDYPLNLPPYLFEGDVVSPEFEQEIILRTQWPTEFWKDATDPWPCGFLDFHDSLELWPIAHITPAMGYVKCLNWLFSWMMNRCRWSFRQLIVGYKGMGRELKDQILFGDDAELLEIEAKNPGTLEKLVNVIQMPEVTKDFWALIAALKREFENTTGVTELQLSGFTPTQWRSAEEAAVKERIMTGRTDDMYNKVEDWMSLTARKEAILARFHLAAEDVAPVFGEALDPTAEMPQVGIFTQLWMQLVHSEDMEAICSELEFRIEAGSAKKPNKQSMAEGVNQVSQVLLPMLQQTYMSTGDPSLLNRWMSKLGESLDLDLGDMQFPPMMMQPAGPPQAGGPPSEPPSQEGEVPNG